MLGEERGLEMIMCDINVFELEILVYRYIPRRSHKICPDVYYRDLSGSSIRLLI